MELRVLEYFLALTREGSVSAAAEALHVSQPTLSRQLIDLETELDTTLFERGRHGITLTEDGMLLRRRASEVIDLVHITESEIMLNRGVVAGEIRVGCAETRAMELLARVMRALQEEHPQVTYKVSSGLAEEVVEQINHGLLDFGLLLRVRDRWGLDSLCLNTTEQAVVLMRGDCDLASKERVTLDDLKGRPMLIPSSWRESNILGLGEGSVGAASEVLGLNVVAEFGLPYNASRMVLAGMGCAVTLEGLIEPSADGSLVVRPFEAEVDMTSYLVWKPFQLRARACEAFLDRARETFARE